MWGSQGSKGVILPEPGWDQCNTKSNGKNLNYFTFSWKWPHVRKCNGVMYLFWEAALGHILWVMKHEVYSEFLIQALVLCTSRKTINIIMFHYTISVNPCISYQQKWPSIGLYENAIGLLLSQYLPKFIVHELFSSLYSCELYKA